MNESEYDELLSEWRDLRLAWLRLSGASSMSDEQREQAEEALRECELKIRRIEGTRGTGDK